MFQRDGSVWREPGSDSRRCGHVQDIPSASRLDRDRDRLATIAATMSPTGFS
jgi:hypothetical protein